MSRLRGALIEHLPFLVLIPLLLLAMTWPTIIQVFDGSGFWLVQHNIDANMLFWDAWYFQRMLAGQADLLFTDLLFHPQGVSLAYHNFSLPHMALLSLLQLFMPADNAFNLAYLLLVGAVAASGYVYLHYLFRDRWLACFGVIVFALCGFVLARPAQIHISFIATIPLSLYCFHRAVAEDRPRLALLAGAITGATAYIGLYTLVSLLIMLGCYVVAFARRRWRSRRYWLLAALMAGCTVAIALPRLAPMLSDAAALSGAMSKNADLEIGTDLMWHFVNFKHPSLGPLLTSLLPIVDRPGWDRVVYLGYIPLALLCLALWQRKTRSLALPWLGLALIFLVLRLGSVLTVNSTRYEHIRLPKYYLTELLPQVFQAFWTPDIFHGGALLPLAVLACLGMTALTRRLPAKYRSPLILCLSLALAYEAYQTQQPFIMPQGRLAFIDWLKTEEDQQSIHLINLPIGGQHAKLYAFYQTYNGYPHAEGRPTRAPATAYDYIDANLLLRHWRAGSAYNCMPGREGMFIAAQSQLLADGFTHIALHHDRMSRESIAANFVSLSAAYHDDFVSVYRLADLDESCQLSALLSPRALPSLQAAVGQLTMPETTSAILSIHSFSDGEQSYAAVLYSQNGITPLPRQDSVGDSEYATSALNSADIIVFVYDPQAADAQLSRAYRRWLAGQFDSCGRAVDSASAVIELFMRRGFPCELALGEAPFSVDYDNGIRLGNLLAEFQGDQLELALLWERLPAEPHAISAQLFDSAGQKAHGQDFVFHRDALQRQTIDLASLPPGRYKLKLIAYNYESGVSLPGTVISREERFARELDVMRLRIK